MCAECLWGGLAMHAEEVAKFCYWNCWWVYWLQTDKCLQKFVFSNMTYGTYGTLLFENCLGFFEIIFLWKVLIC